MTKPINEILDEARRLLEQWKGKRLSHIELCTWAAENLGAILDEVFRATTEASILATEISALEFFLSEKDAKNKRLQDALTITREALEFYAQKEAATNKLAEKTLEHVKTATEVSFWTSQIIKVATNALATLSSDTLGETQPTPKE